MRKRTDLLAAALLLSVAVASLASEEPVLKTTPMSYKSLSPERRQGILQYLADKTVALPGGDVVQYRFPKYGLHGVSWTRTGMGWYTHHNDADLDKRGVRRIDSGVSQSAKSGDLYLIDDGSAAVVVPGNASLTDDNQISGWATEDGIYEYKDVLGANRRVKKYRMLNTDPLTEDALLSALQKGGSFLIQGEVKQITCPKCHGWSREKKTCDTCRQTGKINEATVVKIIQ